MSGPYLSVVLPSVGRTQELLSTIADLERQHFKDWECLVVLQGDRPGEQTLEPLRQASARVRVFYCAEPNASLARNVGLREARGQIVLYLDDDVLIERDTFLDAHVREFDRPGTVAVRGQILEPDRKVRDRAHPWSFRRDVGWLYLPRNFAHRCETECGGSGNLSVRREAARAVGGMDAQFERGAHREESDFCLRLVAEYGRIVHVPEASLVHLGAAAGGCRSWSGAKAAVGPARHHRVGEWYFIIRHVASGLIRPQHLHHHLYALWRRQICPPGIRSPVTVARAFGSSVGAALEAKRKTDQPPRLLDTLRVQDYECVA